MELYSRDEYEAQKCFEEALEIYKEKLPSNDEDIADTIESKGSIYSEEGKYEEAFDIYNINTQKVYLLPALFLL